MDMDGKIQLDQTQNYQTSAIINLNVLDIG